MFKTKIDKLNERVTQLRNRGLNTKTVVELYSQIRLCSFPAIESTAVLYGMLTAILYVSEATLFHMIVCGGSLVLLVGITLTYIKFFLVAELSREIELIENSHSRNFRTTRRGKC